MDELKRWLSLFGIRGEEGRLLQISSSLCAGLYSMYVLLYVQTSDEYVPILFSLSLARPTYPSSVVKTAPNLSLRRSCSFFPSCTLFFVFPFPLSGLTVVTDGFNCWKGLGEVGTGEGKYWYLQCIYFVLYNT